MTLFGQFFTVLDVAGEVVKVGSEVKNFKVGDKVVCMLKCFGKFL